MKKSVTITPAALSGTLKIMPSKSFSHRAAICAALAKSSVVENKAWTAAGSAAALALMEALKK